MKAVVLAAGLGTRMRPLTFTKPKFLLPVAGRPLLDHTFTILKNAGIEQVAVVVGFCKDQIADRYGDGSKVGLKLVYLHQKEPLGTANAVSVAEDFVRQGHFLVMNGDILVDQESLKSLLRRHDELGSSVDFGGIMATVEVDEPEQFGMVFLKGEKISDVVEKPGRARSRLANAGIYVFAPAIFKAIEQTKPSSRGEYELTASIKALIKGGKSVYSLPLHQWVDIGRPWDLLVANEQLLRGLRGEIRGEVEPGARVGENVHVGEGTLIRSGSYILGPTYIGRDCDIGPNCFIRPYTSIGDDVRIGNAVEVKNSIIMDHTNVGHLSYVGDSIIGSHCNLGAGTIIANLRLDEEPVGMMMERRLVSSGRRKLGAVIADNVRTGINCTINVGVKIGPDSAVGPGTFVQRDVPPKTFVFARPTVKMKKWRPKRS
jgi:bifunctional UDP-N-acetylglucosamine pyrophosphorylase/glucosamine-1-phosphate N-acetyltransferase